MELKRPYTREEIEEIVRRVFDKYPMPYEDEAMTPEFQEEMKRQVEEMGKGLGLRDGEMVSPP